MDQQSRTEKETNRIRLRRQKKRRKGRVILWGAVLIVIGFWGWKVHQADAASGSEPDPIRVVVPADMREDLQANEKPIQRADSGQTIERISIGGDISDHAADRSSADDAWSLILVNSTHPLPGGYKPPLAEVEEWYRFDARAAESLTQMLNDARKAGLSPKVCSAYRSTEKQTTLFNRQVNIQKQKGYDDWEAREKAQTVVAYPGTSEHQLGLAADIVATDYQILDEKQANTPEADWLMENCWKYGFILRYPPRKSDITGVIYEPWHYRYVGIAAATVIMENGLCLEEYLDEYGY